MSGEPINSDTLPAGGSNDNGAPAQNPAQAGNTAPAPASWRDSIPEEFREDPNLVKHESVESLARGYVNAVSMIGREQIPMPKTDDDFRDVYAKLGMPEAADKYTMPAELPQIPEDVYTPEALASDVEWFRQVAHENGLSDTQFQRMLTAYMGKNAEYAGGYQATLKAEIDKAEQTLRQKWGNGYEGNLNATNQIVGKLFPESVVKAIEVSGLGRNPDFVLGLHALAPKLLEEMGLDASGNSMRTPKDTQADISKYMAHPAYLDKTHPEHKIVVDRVTKLFEEQAAHSSR